MALGWRRFVWGLVLAAFANSALAADDFKRAEEVFRHAQRIDNGQLIVTWTIEPKHYLYKHRLGFEAKTPDVSLGEVQWPKGEKHEDEFFGVQEIYRGTVDFRMPIAFAGPAPEMVELALKLQGCADAGLCYPPSTWAAKVSVPQTSKPAATSTSGGLGQLRSLFGGSKQDDEFLPVDQAFKLTGTVVAPDRIELSWVLAPGYYLYKHRFGAESLTEGVQLGSLALPPGTPKHDEFFGDTEVYYEIVDAAVPVSRAAGSSRPIEVKVSYQGCADAGLCYPPTTKTVSLELPATNTAATLTTTPPGTLVAEQDRLATLLRDGNLLAVLGTFFGMGLLLSFTPCVLPMIPILSGIIVGQGGTVSPRRGFALAMTYVQGMALTYAAAGAAFVLAFKQAPQAFFQQPWVIVSFAVLFIALALAMFGAYNLQLPSGLQTRLTNFSNQQKSGTYIGTFVMGALSALVVTACVAPAVVAALSVISQSGEVARGAGALYATGLGMGLPLLLVGASAGTVLPRVGPWMDTVKQLFGVLFLLVAVYLLGPLLPDAVSMLLYAALAMVAGFWIFSLKARDGGAAPSPVRAAGLIALVYGILLLIGVASGSYDPLQPLNRLASGSGETPSGATAAHGLEFKRIKSTADLERELAAAAANDQPVMLDFYADWCVSCKEMEKYTFTDASVQSALSNVVLLQADVTANDQADQALMQHFEIFGPPTIAFFAPDGTERRNFRIVGYMPADEFAPHVIDALGTT